jgi:oxazoline/thiazoline synthase
VARLIADDDAPDPARLLALDLARLRLDEHAVVRRPQCPACGDPGLVAARARQPVVLASQPVRFSDDGGRRCATPDETFARYQHLVSPVTGVVTEVAPLVGRDHPLRPVHRAAYFVCPPADTAIDGDEFARPSLGKGRTAAQARTGALCEAIERHSAIAQGDEAILRARLSQLGDEAVPPPALLHFSDEQYRRRDQLNRGARDQRRQVPLPFDERVEIGWTPAWSLTGERRYLPAAYCYLHAPEPPEARFCSLDPSGHAAGNCLEEAILQGFLELAERDAVGIWWYGRIRRPSVDLASFGVPYFAALEEHYRGLGYRLWVLDLTNDLELPAFVAVGFDRDARRVRVGFGCHLEARLGVQRALTELNQLFDPADRSAAPWGDAPLDDDAFLRPDQEQRPRNSDDYPVVDTTDIADDVRTCIARAARLGLETLVLDQTRPDVGLHAVKVVVPGLRHFWPRLGPGRLYDVPVRLGWLARPRAEAELNPVPLHL